MVPILRFNYFQFPIGLPTHFFCFGTFFGKTPYLSTSVVPVLLRIYGVRIRFVLEKTVASFNFHFRAIMVDADRLLLCVCVCNGCYLSSNDVAKCNECVKKNVSQPNRVYYRWKSLLE